MIATAIVALLAATSQGAASPPPLYLTYHINGTLGVSLADGSNVGAGSAIPPGPYWVTISNEFFAEGDTIHKWHLFGPGVELSTDLNNGDNKIEQYLETLQPGSTYTVQDDYHPALQVVFRTSATGSSTSVSVGGTSTGKSSGSVAENTAVVGSEAMPFRGALAGAVSAGGKLTLTRDGRPVAAVSLRIGRYTIVVFDRSKSVGFTLERTGHAARTITTGPFTGRKAIELDLRAGQWLFFGGGPKSRFVVGA